MSETNGMAVGRGAEVSVEDLLETVKAEVQRSAARLADEVTVLEAVSLEAFDATGDIRRDDPSQEVFQRAYRVQALVQQAGHALLALQREAGRLLGLASLLQMNDFAEGGARRMR